MVVNAGTLTLNGNIRPNTTGRSLVLSGAGSGSANGIISDGTATGQVLSLVKNDSGLWTLAGANTYSGTTNVTQGTLLIKHPGSLHASSAVTVSGGVLGGDGTIGGSVTLAATGSLAPGASAGGLTIGGDLNVSAQATGSGKLLLDLATPATSDRIAVKGTLVIGSAVLGFGDFVFNSPAALTHGTYKLITTGGITGSLDATSLSGPVGAFIGTLQLSGNDLELVLAPSGFAAWRTLNGATGTIADDHDGDGISDGIEYFLGGPSGTTTGFTAVPGITNTNGILSITWTMGAGYAGTYGNDFAVETSATLTGPWTIEPPSGNVTITGSAVKYNFPASPGTKRFARLKVMSP